MVASPSPIVLKPWDPESPVELAELKRQRILCGWGLEDVESWRALARTRDRMLFWIFPRNGADFPLPEEERMSLTPEEVGPARPDEGFAPLGHIALDYEDYAGDKELASREDKRATLATFFILTSLHGKGLGTLAVREIEAMAASPEIGATEITLNTLSKAYMENLDLAREAGLPINDNMRVNEVWYSRMGYKPFKIQSRYPWTHVETGEPVKLKAVFMRKSLV